ncbi:hypothetical protein [Paenibacillus vini]|uniref:Uncharacterized protein n=1 Tax=Paenibacillus vini TaxID=1476024 RepID=A0ABQ4M766_9BACL|nr:hypothetical protein [Paenibacillus vini]GIP51815.1 hypothetical protein J42TS3_08500 [Paenibacillus vini]
MTEQINDLLDTQISLNRLIWLMDDETYDRLFELTRQHLRLAKEGIEPYTSPERKTALKQEIEHLRTERESIIINYEKTIQWEEMK